MSSPESNTENPYTPPQASAEAGPGGPSFPRGNPLWIPSVVLLIQSALTLGICLWGLVVLAESTWKRHWRPGPEDLVPLTIFITGLISQVAVIVGSVSALRMKRYSAAWWGAVVACIPLPTPCCVFGIPLGMWIILELRREDVKLKFAEREARTE